MDFSLKGAGVSRGNQLVNCALVGCRRARLLAFKPHQLQLLLTGCQPMKTATDAVPQHQVRRHHILQEYATIFA